MRLLSLVVIASILTFGPSISTACEPGAPTVRHAASPLTAKWAVRSKSDGQVVLAARVELGKPLEVPVSVRVDVPKDASVGGELEFLVPAGDLFAEKEFVVSYGKPPKGDLKLKAEAKATGFAFRASDSYRFGRSPKHAPVPNTSGPRVKVGGRDFGPSTPLN